MKATLRIATGLIMLAASVVLSPFVARPLNPIFSLACGASFALAMHELFARKSLVMDHEWRSSGSGTTPERLERWGFPSSEQMKRRPPYDAR